VADACQLPHKEEPGSDADDDGRCKRCDKPVFQPGCPTWCFVGKHTTSTRHGPTRPHVLHALMGCSAADVACASSPRRRAHVDNDGECTSVGRGGDGGDSDGSCYSEEPEECDEDDKCCEE
jgi:hypothetical protein